MAKSVDFYDNYAGGSNWLSADYDHVIFKPNFVELITEAGDIRLHYSWAFPDVKRIEISPLGVAYPGHAAAGTGSKTVTVDFKPASQVFTLVDFVDFSTGWLIITKGVHLVVYSPTIVYSVTVEPS